MSCPTCKEPIEASYIPEIQNEVLQLKKLREQLLVKAVKIAKSQGLDFDKRLATQGDRFFGNLKPLA